jgi:hypothetical protein
MNDGPEARDPGIKRIVFFQSLDLGNRERGSLRCLLQGESTANPCLAEKQAERPAGPGLLEDH